MWNAVFFTHEGRSEVCRVVLCCVVFRTPSSFVAGDGDRAFLLVRAGTRRSHS